MKNWDSDLKLAHESLHYACFEVFLVVVEISLVYTAEQLPIEVCELFALKVLYYMLCFYKGRKPDKGVLVLSQSYVLFLMVSVAVGGLGFRLNLVILLEFEKEPLLVC